MPRKLEAVVPLKKDTVDRQKVRAAIEARGLILADAGELVGRSKQWMSKWLKHRCEIKDSEVLEWVRAFGVSKGELLEGRYDSINYFEQPASGAA